MSEDSDAESFKSAYDDREASPLPETSTAADQPRFSAEEEAALVSESNEQKTLGNGFFASADFSTAIQTYEKSLAACPNYLDYEVAVLKANIAACNLKLAEWKAAVDSATAALDALERLDPSPALSSPAPADGRVEGLNGAVGEKQGQDTHSQFEPVVEEVDDATAERIEALARSGRSRDDVQRIRCKALMRRAKGREEIGGWAELAAAEEDYKRLTTIPTLSSLDRKAVDKALRALPPRLEAAKQQEMGEMMGKLKDLGNGILKPFGLSTDNFQFVKDETTGGYSMSFNQGAGKG